MKHQTAVKALSEAIAERAARASALNMQGGTPAEDEARFFEAEELCDEVAQLQHAIDVLQKG